MRYQGPERRVGKERRDRYFHEPHYPKSPMNNVHEGKTCCDFRSKRHQHDRRGAKKQRSAEELAEFLKQWHERNIEGKKLGLEQIPITFDELADAIIEFQNS